MTLDPVISANQLRKNFGTLVAVAGIDFQIFPGECFGFLGPNGAGKTSTMRMIYCFSPLSAGSLKVFGRPVQSSPREIKSRIGVVPQDDLLDTYLTVRENLLLYAHYFDVPKKDAERRAQELLDFFSLGEKANQPLNQLSGGMRRRLLIARALINQPDLLVLDEPTTGLDPQARHLIWAKLRALKSHGVTMVLTTHYMEEAGQLCDRLVIMDQGKILAQESPQALVEKHVGKEVMEIRGPEKVLAMLKDKIKVNGIQPTELVADTLYVRLRDRDHKLWEAYPEIRELDFHCRPATLEDVFLKLTGRELRD
jgi:lipooligosaccharide transport system ATP-binding protein